MAIYVIPNIFKEQTRGMPSKRLGNWIWHRRMLSTKTISDVIYLLQIHNYTN